VEEARALLPYRHLPAADTVGYRELFRYFDGEWTLDEAISRIKQHTRHYARRQLTWFRNQGHYTWWDAFDSDGLIQWLEKETS
jgi:tRNA dimethylallyltransferase